MKKKVIIISLALMLLMVGAVSAAANWGKFEGYNIVRLVIDGKVVTPKDTPPVILKGRTMVPLAMLKQAGVTATWDADTYTVNVESEKQLGTKDILDEAYTYDYKFIKKVKKDLPNLIELIDASVVSYEFTKEIHFNVNANNNFEELSYYVVPVLTANSYAGYFDYVKTDISSEGRLLMSIKVDVKTVDQYAVGQIDEMELIRRSQVIQY